MWYCAFYNYYCYKEFMSDAIILCECCGCYDAVVYESAIASEAALVCSFESS